eukprot:5702062-Amphidinium_carterae.2
MKVPFPGNIGMLTLEFACSMFDGMLPVSDSHDGQKLATPWSPQAFPNHNINLALSHLTSKHSQHNWRIKPGMAANDNIDATTTTCHP